MNKPQLHLASSSPRRREILDSLGLSFSYAGVDLDETPGTNEPAEDLVRRLATAKAEAAAGSIDVALPILGADTLVELDGEIFGKPGCREQGLQMLAALSGRTHCVHTAVALVAEAEQSSLLVSAEVTFRAIRPEEAAAYWESGEPSGKAGAYAIQGTGGIFVQNVAGSYTAVVGLPVFETAQLLARIGISPLGDLPERLSVE